MSAALDPEIATESLLHAPLGVVIIDRQRRVRWLNPAAESMFGAASGALLNKTADTVASFWREVIFAPSDTMHLAARDHHPGRWLQTWRATHDDGHAMHYYADVTGLQQALEEKARLDEELAQHTTRDALTGLPNRHALLQGIEPLVSRSRRYHNPLSVIRLRIDNLADLDNDHGGGSGDAALVTVAHMLKDQMRWADLIGRFDADEFLLVLPETAGDAAIHLKDKLQQRLQALESKGTDGQIMKLVAQFGVADWQQGDDRAKMLKRARDELEQSAK